MPRAFLIKKKKTYGLSSASSGIYKKKSSSATLFIGVTNLQEEICKRKEHSYDSESESGRSSVSSQIPSPSPSPNPPLIPASAAALLSGSNLMTDLYSRTTSILEPLNLNANSTGPVTAAALPWMKPFLTPYLPFNFPYHPHYAHTAIRSDTPYHHPATASHIFATSDSSSSSSSSSSSISPIAHRIFHPHHGASIPRGTLYPSRSEPPSPSCPCPLSPYTPPRDGTPTHLKDQQKTEDSSDADQVTSRDGKRTLQYAADTRGRDLSVRTAVTTDGFHRVDRRSSPVYWTEQDRCRSNGSIHSDGPGGNDGRTTSESDAVQTTLTQQQQNGSTAGSGSRRRTSDGGPRYQCPDCNKSYSTYSGLSKHQQFHCATTNKKSFSCKYCDKVYMSLGALKMHIRTHTLPCKCKLCGKAFSRPWLLQGHIRTHTGEKPFACPHCNRAFADRSNLRAHLQTHSDVKKYSCKTCAKTFSRMSLLSKHEDGGCAANMTGGALVQDRFEP